MSVTSARRARKGAAHRGRIERVWELSLRYDPSRGSTFANFAARYVRVAGYFRARDGRTVWKFSTYTYVRPRPVFVSLDDHLELASADGDPAASESVRELLGRL